jgi:4-hydroxybenzoate polyprenyltransferase
MGWLQLLRVPNLFTVPGDPVAGFLLASTDVQNVEFLRMLPAVIASFFLYCFGLITNDWFDLAEDRRERPGRPLPSGAVDPGTALAVGVTLAVLGLFAAFIASVPSGFVAVALVVLILLYNARVKRSPGWGPVNMGLCRGLSLLIGVAAAAGKPQEHPGAIAAFVIIVFYITAVTLIAARETRHERLGSLAWNPLLAIILCFAFYFTLLWKRLSLDVAPLMSALVVFIAGLTIIDTARLSYRVWKHGSPQVVPQAIGGFLRALLFIQAFLVVFSGFKHGTVTAAVLLAAWPVSWLLSKRFYAS